MAANQDQTVQQRSARIACEDADEQAHIAFENGAEGVEILNQQEYRMFFRGTTEDFKACCARLETLGHRVIDSELVPVVNWVQRCDEIWQPMQIGGFTIQPTLQTKSGEVFQPQADLIRIVPGEGFGTGHHSTTAMALEFISGLAETEPNLMGVFDAGTGSGILAIAAALKFQGPVRACDIDQDALTNAAENASLNGVTERIQFQLGSVEDVQGAFNLIAANIYAEVLCGFEYDFHRLLSPGGHIILTGIMDSKSDSVEACFCEPSWQLQDKKQRGGWTALRLIRK